MTADETPMTADETPIDRVDLEALDSFLSSERAPPNSLALSDLDGFLTGIAVGPELVTPSEWLPQIWGGEEPVFADRDEAKAIVGAIMGRYNEILGEIAAGTPSPIFWEGQDGAVVSADWAEGFLQAIGLRTDAWSSLLKSERDGQMLIPILALCGDENGDSLLDLDPEEEDRASEDAPELIPACVLGIAAYWRMNGVTSGETPSTEQ
jgi:uncharacterized protein